MIQVSMYVGFKTRMGDVSLLEVLRDIRRGKYATAIRNIRANMDKGDAGAADRLKRCLPAITLSATYGEKRKAECMTGYNPLIILDFDDLKPEELPRLLAGIREMPYTVACWISPRGRGIKVVVHPVTGLEAVAANHKATYKRVKDWYEHRLGIAADASGSDPGRLCIVSYDPGLYLSPRYEAWLQGEGSLPEGLPLMEAPAKDKTAARLGAARKKATRKMAYAEGNRNNYVHLFASYCNRMGIAREAVDRYAAGAFTDLADDERRQAIESAYARTDEFATEPQGGAGGGGGGSRRGEGFVPQIQAFLGEHYHLRRNVVSGKVEYRDLKQHAAYLPVTDYWENSVWCALQRLGVFCRLSDLRAVVHSDFSSEFDPFRSYFENLAPWDGQDDAIARLAATVDTSCPDYWVKCLKKWLVALVACAIDPRQANHTVLLLSGAQGIGKTTWLRNLVPPRLRDYVYSGNLDPTDKDASLLMSDCLLIILDELSGQSRMELNRLKALITKDSILERRPYARNAEAFVRRASFAATVNDSQVLTDRTGSRRFLCFEASRIDYTSPVDHAAVYAQALALYRSGFRFWFAEEEIGEINRNNDPFQQICPEAELLLTYFRRPERFEPPQLLSASEILSHIGERTRYSGGHLSVIQLGKVLKSLGFEWKMKLGKRLFSVIELSHDQVVARQKGLNGDSENSSENADNKDNIRNNPSDPQLPF